jgi:small nuclear ribonucleoprotein (snRNP)-like protein
MNIVLDDAVEEKADGGKDRLGMVVRSKRARILGCGEG